MKLFKKKNVKNVFTVEGNTNELLQVSNNGEMKQTRLFYLISDNPEEYNEETMDVCITSSNPYKSFPIFDELLDKKIRVSIDIIEE